MLASSLMPVGVGVYRESIQADLGSAKKPRDLCLLVGLERAEILSRQLEESLTQARQSHTYSAVADAKVLSEIAQRDVPTHADHQHELLLRKLARRSVG